MGSVVQSTLRLRPIDIAQDRPTCPSMKNFAEAHSINSAQAHSTSLSFESEPEGSSLRVEDSTGTFDIAQCRQATVFVLRTTPRQEISTFSKSHDVSR